jgi:coenzyme PQQ precursor peptide PqqA
LSLSGLRAIYYPSPDGLANPLKLSKEEMIMKTWMKPSVREQEVGLEVTSYLPAEIDLI